MAQIGDLCETNAELKIEWKIKNFITLCEKNDALYESSKFYFSGASWVMWIYPNGETKNETNGYVSLYLMRESTGLPVTLDYSLGFKTVEGKEKPCISYKNVFAKYGSGWGNSKFISVSELKERKSELTSSDVLTVICTMKNSETNPVAGSLFSRQQKVCSDMRNALIKSKSSDITLKVDGYNIPANQVILEARSPIFARMLKPDKKGKRRKELTIKGITKKTMELILEYMYSGDIQLLKPENVVSVYAAAEKFYLQDLKDICLEYVEKNMSVNSVCDVIRLADLHKKKEIGLRAREYFRKNAREIIKTEEWEMFSLTNVNISVELLNSVLKDLLPGTSREN